MKILRSPGFLKSGLIFFVALCATTARGFGPATVAIPNLPAGAMLGSEQSFSDVGRGQAINGAAQSQAAYIVAIDNLGRLTIRESAAYTTPWRQPAGCATPRSCYNSYSASGKKQTDWGEWRFIRTAERYEPTISPVILRMIDGQSAIALVQTSPETKVVLLRMRNDLPINVLSKIDLSPPLKVLPVALSAQLVGGRHSFGQTFVLAAISQESGSFRLFSTELNTRVVPLPEERRVAPSGVAQVSRGPISISSYGTGNIFGVVSYSDGTNWLGRRYAIRTTATAGRYELKDLGEQRFTGLGASTGPQMIWLPGNYILSAFKDQADRLNFSLGLHTAENIGLPRGKIVDQTPVNDFTIFSRDQDVYVAAVHTDLNLRLYRLNFETTNRFLQPILVTRLPARGRPKGLNSVQFGKETFLTYAGTNGVLYWYNAHRSAARYYANQLQQFHYATPEMNGFNPWELMAWSAFGTALSAMPWQYHELYKKQPLERCHPAGFRPPLACGKVFFEWNDYGAIPAPAPGVWQTKNWAIRTLEDRNPNNNWSLGLLKAFRGSVLLRSAVDDVPAIFHELAHEVDYDGINGELVPELEALRPDWTAIFGDRVGAGAGDFTRASGYVSDYAETNQAEDWADTAMHYRWHGALFRYNASYDKARGDIRLANKYEFTKRFFKGVEYSHFGSPFYGNNFAPLHWLRHNVQDDNMLSSMALPTVDLEQLNYRIQRFGSEGWTVTRSLGTSTLPLRIMQNRFNGDLTVAAKENVIRWLESFGYVPTGQIVGYALAEAGPNRVRMHHYYSTDRREAAVGVSKSTKETHEAPGRYDRSIEDAWVLSEPFL